MRIVLDTNVLIAAYATRGHCHDVLEHRIGNHVVFSSEVLLAELDEKPTRKPRVSRDTSAGLPTILRSRIEIVDPLPLDPHACRDPGDDRVIATAAAGGRDCIVTGDGDLPVLHPYRTIAIIISPSGLWRAGSA